MKKQRVFVIGGPTASGKTALALRLADKLNGQIVNGDAIQVYEDLRILSARPSVEEEQQAPHYLFGYVDAWHHLSVAEWLQAISSLIPTLENPIVVGGTGMYLDSLVNGVSPIPEIPSEVRDQVRQMPIEEVKSLIKDYRFTDPQRLRRALEVQKTTGKPISYFQSLPKRKYIEADFVEIHVLPDRERVYHSCKERFEQMIQIGAITEVQKLLEKKATGGVLKAIGVPEITAYLNKKISKEEMILSAVTATRQYAKRQMTWFRHHGHPKHIVTDVKQINIEDITK